MGYLRDLGCPQHFKSEVVKLEIIDPLTSFKSCLNGTLVYKVKPSEVSLDVRLIGVVVDDDGENPKGYLIEYPRARGRVVDPCGEPVSSWERRER